MNICDEIGDVIKNIENIDDISNLIAKKEVCPICQEEFNEVRVYSTHGVLLMKSNSQALTVSSLPSGIYLFEVEFKDSITQRRIVKK